MKFHLTLRDLFWLTVIVAILCFWYVQDRDLRGVYNGEMEKVIGVMRNQDVWRLQNVKMRRLIEAEGYEVITTEDGDALISRKASR